METNKTNSSASQTQGQAKANTTPSSGTQSNTNRSSSSSSDNRSSSSSSESNSSQNMQGRSSQKATSGKGGVKDIQSKLKEYGNTAANKLSKMTTTQKAALGGAVLALGAGWVALSKTNKNKIKSQVNSAASTAKKAMHDMNAKQQQNSSGSSSGSSSSKSSSGSSNSDARVK